MPLISLSKFYNYECLECKIHLNYNHNMIVAAAVTVADDLAIPHAAAADIAVFAAGFAAVAADDGFLGAVMLVSNPYP